MPDCDHGDARAITTLLLAGAGEFSGIDVPTVVGNIAETLAAQVAPQASTKGARAAVGVVVKTVDEQRFLLTVAYAADRIDPHVGQDRCKDFARPPIVEKAAWDFVRKGAGVGMWHRPGGEGSAEVVESYIYRRDDPWVIKAADGTEQRIMPGDWLVGLVLTEPAWELYKAGQIAGVSVQGRAKRRTPDAETLARVRSRAVA